MIDFSRQTRLREIGEEGQKKLAKSTVAVVGVGALGTVAAELLARSGIGKLVLIDRDLVEESNLQRQILFTKDELGRSKTSAATERLLKINENICIEQQPIHLNAKNIELLQGSDIILDCTDNLSTRFLLNDFCRKEKIPLMYGAAIKTKGYVMPILGNGPCLRCFLEEASLETCETAGVLNTITASIASMQVTFCLKILLKKEVEQTLYYLDLWNQNFKKLNIKKNKNCSTCQGSYHYLEKKEEVALVKFCSSGLFQISGTPKEFNSLKKNWENIGGVVEDQETLRFKEMILFKNGRVLIKAGSEKEALSIYSKWIGN